MYRKYQWWKVVTLCFMASWMAYLVRICLSQAMLPMSEAFGWTETEQGKLFSSFYYGYLITQIPGGWLSQRCGAKWVILFGILGSALLNSLVPLAAHRSFTMVLCLRGLIGFVQGVFWPSCLHLLACWMDAKHASLAVAIVVSGQHLGTATAQGAYPLIAERATWEAPFYLIGILGCTWALVWMNLISSNPPPYFEDDFEDSFVEVARDIPKEASTSVKTDPASPDHPVINNLNINVPASPQTPATPLSFMDDEAYVNDEFEPLILSFYSAGKSQMPWYRFFRFPSVWAYFCVFFAYNWSFYLLVSYLPKFLTSILGFTMKEAGEVGLWAYLGLYCSILVGGRLNSHFISKGYSPTVVRKVGVSLGLIPAMLLILAVTMPWFELTSNQISKCLLLSISLTGFAQSSFAPNPIDLAPTSPAFIASLGNMVATLPGIFSSLFTGHILEDVGNCHAASNTLMSNVTKLWISDDCYAAWMIIFRVCVGVYFSGWIVWVFFSRARPLPRPTPVSPIHLQL